MIDLTNPATFDEKMLFERVLYDIEHKNSPKISQLLNIRRRTCNCSIKEAIEKFPLLRGNYSIYERESNFPNCRRSKRELNLFEFPVLQKRREFIEETNIYNIHNAIGTRNTKDTIDRIVRETKIDKEHIEPHYYKDNDDIASSLILYWPVDDIDANYIYKILELFNDAGYYMVDEEIIETPEEETLYVMFIEPYCPSEDLRRRARYVYHITPEYNDKSISENGFLVKSESHKYNIKSINPDIVEEQYPDRIYFFIEDNIVPMLMHIRTSRKLKPNDNKELLAVIYTVKIPEDVPLYLDVRALDPNGQLIENCVYTYENIPPECIIDKEIINVCGSMFNLTQ